MHFSNYAPGRVKKVFVFLLTVYLLIKKKERFLFMEPLSPAQLRESINELGASFIKLAQVLATRADFFSDTYLAKLRSLHDEIPPMPQKRLQESLCPCIWRERPPLNVSMKYRSPVLPLVKSMRHG